MVGVPEVNWSDWTQNILSASIATFRIIFPGGPVNTTLKKTNDKQGDIFTVLGWG